MTHTNSTVRNIFRILLGLMLAYTGISHLTWARQEFTAQVPGWVPLDGDLVVILSGIVEILLALGLIALPRYRVQVGWICGSFFRIDFSGKYFAIRYTHRCLRAGH